MSNASYRTYTTIGYSPSYGRHYESVYPYRKCMMFGGMAGIICGLILFVLTPVLGISTNIGPGIAVCGFLGILLLAGSCFACQCGYASVRWHDIQQNGGGVVYTATTTGGVSMGPPGMHQYNPGQPGYPPYNGPMQPPPYPSGYPAAPPYPGQQMPYPPTGYNPNLNPPQAEYGYPPSDIPPPMDQKP